jgi:hypothetical protein
MSLYREAKKTHRTLILDISITIIWNFLKFLVSDFVFALADCLLEYEYSYLSTQSKRLDVGLLAGASWPPQAYRKPLQIATPTPPRRLFIGEQSDHLFVCGS